MMSVGGRPIRVLVVDDSVVVRRLAIRELESDPRFNVVGWAADGATALLRLEQARPDVITLDTDMPEMDGLTVLRQIKRLHPAVRVVMFSALTGKGAATALEALALGADDYVTKGRRDSSSTSVGSDLRTQLIPKLKQFFPRSERPASKAEMPVQRLPLLTSTTRALRIVGIGVSTGGPNALAQIVAQFPADFPVPVLIVQHMPRLFTRFLCDRLQGRSKLRIREASDGEILCHGTILVAPGDFHLTVAARGLGHRIVLDQGPPQNSCRPSVDVLFESLAAVYGAGALGVVLTGMGPDGRRGAGLLKQQGAAILAQNEATCVIYGMPRAIVEAGLADEVLPLNAIVPEIVRRVENSAVLLRASLLASPVYP